MRQAGILASAGLLALQNIGRLREDHRNARRLAEGIGALPGLFVDMDQMQTNIVVIRVQGSLTASRVVSLLKERGIKCSTFGPDLIRMVTHLNISPEDIEYTIKTARELLS